MNKILLAVLIPVLLSLLSCRQKQTQDARAENQTSKISVLIEYADSTVKSFPAGIRHSCQQKWVCM